MLVECLGALLRGYSAIMKYLAFLVDLSGELDISLPATDKGEFQVAMPGMCS